MENNKRQTGAVCSKTLVVASKHLPWPVVIKTKYLFTPIHPNFQFILLIDHHECALLNMFWRRRLTSGGSRFYGDTELGLELAPCIRRWKRVAFYRYQKHVFYNFAPLTQHAHSGVNFLCWLLRICNTVFIYKGTLKLPGLSVECF